MLRFSQLQWKHQPCGALLSHVWVMGGVRTRVTIARRKSEVVQSTFPTWSAVEVNETKMGEWAIGRFPMLECCKRSTPFFIPSLPFLAYHSTSHDEVWKASNRCLLLWNDPKPFQLRSSFSFFTRERFYVWFRITHINLSDVALKIKMSWDDYSRPV